MTSSLIYIFAGAACALALWFVVALCLSYMHAKLRRTRAPELHDYIAHGRTRLRGVHEDRINTAHQRRRVMHLTIGDFIRDERLATAVLEGIYEKLRPADVAPDSESPAG
jgi:hypothetical protein